MTAKITYLFFFVLLIVNFSTKNILFETQKASLPKDTILEIAFYELEEKFRDYSFDLEDDEITIRTSSSRKNDSLTYVDFSENKKVTFIANDLTYTIDVYKNKKKWFTSSFDKNENLSKYYENDYEYLTKSDAPEFQLFCEKSGLFIFNIRAGDGINYFILDTKGNIKSLGDGKFKKKNNRFIASTYELYNIQNDTTLILKDLYKQKFRGELEGLEPYFELISDSTIMIAYFYDIYSDLIVNGNLLILNKDFEIIKRNTIRKCPNARFHYEMFGSYLAIFNAKFESVKLYSARENKFYSLVKNDELIKEKKSDDDNTFDYQESAYVSAMKKNENSVKFISRCPSNVEYVYQIDTLAKKILSYQIDEVRD